MRALGVRLLFFLGMKYTKVRKTTKGMKKMKHGLVKLASLAYKQTQTPVTSKMNTNIQGVNGVFNKEKIKQTMNQLGIDNNQYILYMGSAMVMNGIRPTTNDLDLGVSKEIFRELAEGQNITIAKWTGDRKFDVGDIEVFEKQNLHEVPSEVIEGVRVQALSSVIEWKENGGREKDLRDIELIKEHMA